MKKDKVLEFIERRFPTDSRWMNGNCYFFALILKDVFGGEIFYEVIAGHFVCMIGMEFIEKERMKFMLNGINLKNMIQFNMKEL